MPLRRQDRLSPLGEYLRRKGLKQIDAARGIAELRGRNVDSAQISQWCTGRRRPALPTLLHIATWTNFEVPVEAWAARPSRRADGRRGSVLHRSVR